MASVLELLLLRSIDILDITMGKYTVPVQVYYREERKSTHQFMYEFMCD